MEHEHQFLNYDGVMKCPCGVLMPNPEETTEEQTPAPVQEVSGQTYPGEGVTVATNPEPTEEVVEAPAEPVAEPTPEVEPVVEATPEVAPVEPQVEAEVNDIFAQVEHMIARLKQIVSRQ